MYQRQKEAQLFTATGIQSHYILRANAKSLSKASACVYLQERISPQVFTWMGGMKMQDNFVKMLGPLCGRKCRGSPGSPCLLLFTALFAAKWAEIKALWRYHSAHLFALHPPPAQVDESFRKPQIHFCSMALRQPLAPHPTCSKRITNWISVWHIHYCKTLCCSPLKARHSAPFLPSLSHTRTHKHTCTHAHTHQPPHPTTTTVSSTPAPFTRPLTLAVLNWAKSKFNIRRGGWGLGLGCLKSSLQRAASVITAVIYAPVKKKKKSAHDYTAFCFVVIMLAFLEHQKEKSVM